jgi:transcriptional regulator with XRE-family HTH domain
MGGLFHDLFRAERKRSGKHMGPVARHINVSVTFLSDVERGVRPPLSPERIRLAAEYMGSDEATLMGLLRAAQTAAKAIELPLPSSERGQEAGAALQRGWASFDDETFERIMDVIGKDKKG